MFKAKSGIGPSLLSDIFEKSFYSGPSLRSDKFFKRPNVRSSTFGFNSLRTLGSKLWEMLPSDIKNSESLEKFKKMVASWRPKCPCQLCRTYVKDLGYVAVIN